MTARRPRGHLRIAAETTLLYADAARSLTLRQILFRARRLLPPRVVASPTLVPDRPPIHRHAAGLALDRAPQSGPQPRPELHEAFCAFGRRRSFPRADFWRDRSDGLLFLFHLHGFSELAAYAASSPSPEGDRFWATVVQSWLDSEGRPRLPGWHPYPTSVRVMSWAAALSSLDWPDTLMQRIGDSLWHQAHYLKRALEHDVGGNHVLKNATALIFAGAAFDSSDLIDVGLRVLKRELAEQILPDGGHLERSTSYHRLIAHDLSEVVELLARSGRTAPPGILRAVDSMATWQQALAGPDHTLPLLNDAWEGPPLPHAPPVDGLTELSDSGYVALRNGDDYAVLDVGPLCPPHLPPHAHADALSFVLWADGRPVVVDPGSYAYTGEWRDRFRGTAAHNTVEVDGVDQCRFWGDFRASNLPRVTAAQPRREGGLVVVEARHDGYRRLADAVLHARAFVWVEGAGIVVVDLLRARRAHEIRSRLHLAPGERNGTDRVGPLRVTALGGPSNVTRREGQYAPFLGRMEPASVLEDRRAVPPERPFGWALLREPWRVRSLERDRLSLEHPEGQAIDVGLIWP